MYCVHSLFLLLICSDCLEIETEDSPAVKALERRASTLFDPSHPNGWMDSFDVELMNEVIKIK